MDLSAYILRDCKIFLRSWEHADRLWIAKDIISKLEYIQTRVRKTNGLIREAAQSLELAVREETETDDHI
jgi:hypothetical protein